jgi:hypothetical protein
MQEVSTDEDKRTDIDRVVVPVTAGHVLVDVGIDPRHCDGRGGRRKRATRNERGGYQELFIEVSGSSGGRRRKRDGSESWGIWGLGVWSWRRGRKAE